MPELRCWACSRRWPFYDRAMRALACTLVLLFLTGCSSEPSKPVAEKAKEPEKPAGPVTGRTAFWKMFVAARLWAQDVQGLRVRSIRLNEIKDQPGKSPAWEATFVSPGRQKQKTFTYSVIEAPGNLHKDVFAGLEENYTQTGQAMPWAVQAFKIDSDAAYEAALKKGEAYAKKNPDKPITFLLEQTKRHPYLSWRVLWGESVATSNYSIYINASTGEYLETGR